MFLLKNEVKRSFYEIILHNKKFVCAVVDKLFYFMEMYIVAISALLCLLAQYFFFNVS